MRSFSERGQASVEAAVLLPVLFLVLGVFVQPAVLLYDKAVMRSAAAEGCRLIATNTASGTAVEAYLLRRLGGVPNLDAFHCGGERGWDLAWGGPDEAGEVSVRIVGRARPLPLFGVAAGLSGAIGADGNVELRVEERSSCRPAWAQQAGSPESWIGRWR